MTTIQLYWTPSSGNTGQTIYYKPTGTSTWSNIPIASYLNTYVLAGLTNNKMYDIKVNSTCGGSEIEMPVTKKFTVSGVDWTFATLSTTNIKIAWNFSSISNIASIKFSIYQGVTLIETQTVAPSLNGMYIFSGLTTNTVYQIVYGVTYTTAMSFPEEVYTAGIGYLTPTQTLTEYKRQISKLTL